MSRERELLKKALLVLPYVSLDVITYAINAEIQSLIAEIESEMSKPLPKPIGWQNKLKPSEFYEYEQLDPLWQNEFRPLYAEPQASKPLTEPVQSRAKKYFSYYPEGGFELHNSAEEAKKSAEYALDTEREYACEGWSEYVDKICWGEVRQHVVETMNRPRTDADHGDSEFATIVDYGLVDIGGDNGNT